MTATTAIPVAELEPVTAMVCRRSGPGRGCVRVRWTSCRGCDWHGDAWDGDQQPLTDLTHRCDPAAVASRRPTGRP